MSHKEVRDIRELLFKNGFHSVQIANHIHVAVFLTEISEHFLVAYRVAMTDMVIARECDIVFTEKLREILIALDILAHAMRQHKQRLGLLGCVDVKMHVTETARAGESACDLLHNKFSLPYNFVVL